jgi:hypothetical protein
LAPRHFDGAQIGNLVLLYHGVNCQLSFMYRCIAAIIGDALNCPDVATHPTEGSELSWHGIFCHGLALDTFGLATETFWLP